MSFRGTTNPTPVPRRRVDGILLVDKPVGPGSNAVLQQAKRLFNAAKAGHAGTLDLLASGLLLVCFGEATKFAQALLDAPKRYRATVRFSVATSTGDAEGDVVARGPVAFGVAELEASLARFVGPIMQQPPRYAALKRNGRPYYDYARAGVEIERTPREVRIDGLRLIGFSPPDAVVDVECSKGTYVRVLAEDVGASLRSCAHLVGLRRTGTAGFSVDRALALDALSAIDEAARDSRLLPIDAALYAMPAIVIDEVTSVALRCGQRPHHGAAPGRYRAYGPCGFIGVVESTGGELRVSRLTA